MKGAITTLLLCVFSFSNLKAEELKSKPKESKAATAVSLGVSAADHVLAALSAYETRRNLVDFPGIVQEAGGPVAKASAQGNSLYFWTQLPAVPVDLCRFWVHGKARWGCVALGAGEAGIYGWLIHHNQGVHAAAAAYVAENGR